eukprot:831803_1
MSQLALLLWFSSIALFGQGDSSLFDTNSSSEFQNQAIVCSNGTSCHIRCDEIHGCRGSTIHCPHDDECTVTCQAAVGKNSVCTDSTIYCPVDNQCNVACLSPHFGGKPCADITIHWPMNASFVNLSLDRFGGYHVQYPPALDAHEDFTMDCHEYPAKGVFCSYRYIMCPQFGSCDIHCEDDECRNSVINYGKSEGPLTVQCGGTIGDYLGNFANCGDSTINCPINASCTLTCDALYSCYPLTINWPDQPGLGQLICNSGKGQCAGVSRPIPDPDTPYQLTCGLEECFAAVITCPSNAECSISCTGDASCRSASIACPETASCDILCDNVDACRDAAIWTESSANVTCGSATDACTGLQQRAPTPAPTQAPTSNPTLPSNNPTTAPTGDPSLQPTLSPTNNPTKPPTNNPSSAPTFQPSKDPSTSPTSNPSSYPSSSPTVPSTHPTKSPTTDPSAHPSLSPTFVPSSNPSSSPTSHPSNIPTTSPTTNPSSLPTFPPSYAPTISPTICYNDADLLIQSVAMDPANEFRANNSNYQYENIANSRITCDNDDDLCTIHCPEYEGCIGAKVIIEEKELSQITIDCNASFSCTEASVHVRDSIIGSISILCAAEQACDSMVIDINVESAIQVNALCIADNACDNLVIIGDGTSDHININLTVTKYSSDITIQYHNMNNINVHCKSSETKFIQYNTDKLMNAAAMKRNVRRQYAANRMPCEDVSISCSESSECELGYSLSSKFDISHILTAKEYTDCLWIDINDIYDVQCHGECALAQPYTHDILFYLDITFEDNNGTALEASTLKPICDEHWDSVNATKDSVQSIDVIFTGVLVVLKSTEDTYDDMIDELAILPITELRNDVQSLECNSMENPLKLATELSLSSKTNDKEPIHELFSADSLFVIESELLIEELFATRVRINITIIDVLIPSDGTGIPKEIVVSSTGGLIGVIIILIGSICYCHKRRAMQREAATMYVSNPMVIGISIGQYDDPIPDESEIDGFLGQLLGIDEDIRNVIHLYRDVLNYEIYPQYGGDDDEIKQHWTKDEMVSLLNDKAKELDASLDTY